MNRILVPAGAFVLAVGLAFAVPAGSTAATSGQVPAARVSSSEAKPKAVNGKKITMRLRAAVRRLHKAPARPGGYVRSKFKLWVDINGDCQDTRSEVLRAEAKAPVTGVCTVRTGKWKPYYNGQVYKKASALDLDHLVPLHEAWASGAKRWSSSKREVYTNDLTESRTLIAVSAHDNRSEGDRDPSAWMPPKGRCKYVTQWAAVKMRWGLAANGVEVAKLKKAASDCHNVRIVTHKARVGMMGGSNSGGGGGLRGWWSGSAL